MIPLRGRAQHVAFPHPLLRTVWRLTDGGEARSRSESACLVELGILPPAGYGLYVGRSGCHAPTGAPHFVELPPALDHLRPDDILSLSPDGQRLRVLWRADSHQNSVLLTERCDNYCLMCSQPPKRQDDSWLLEEALELIRLLPATTREISFTGGEPTLYGSGLLRLLRLCRNLLPASAVHVLSNGRRFADPEYARGWADVENPELMVGIPIYGAEASQHDYVVQAQGAFTETVRGILNLGELAQRIELRVVVHKQTVPQLAAIAEYIARNLPFVEQVALMGLEMTGFARANMEDIWIDPFEYRAELSEAVGILSSARLRTMVYNHQLCLIDRSIWPYAARSISDWKNEYHEECASCNVRERCGGFFFSAQNRMSSHIAAISEPLASPRSTPEPLASREFRNRSAV